MCCSIKSNSTTRRVILLAALVLLVFTDISYSCSICQSRITREIDDLKSSRLLSKKDIFMSRGWGAGGGTAFTSRTKPELYNKKKMLVEMRGDESSYEHNIEPRVEFLQSLEVRKPAASRRRLPAYVPQLFISSNWGPLGK